MDMVILANAWSAAGQNPTGKHQIAKTLAAKGHRVLWIEGAGMRRPSASSGADRSRIRAKVRGAFRGVRPVEDHIWHIAPLIIPFPRFAFIRFLNALIYTLAGRWVAGKLGFHRPVWIHFLPVVPHCLRFWPWKAVYYCVDRWDQFDLYNRTMMTRVDAQCCRWADGVLTTSRDLQDRCSRHNANTVLIGHGVNWAHFNRPLREPVPRPDDLPEGRIVGFFGLLSEWVDQDLILALAQALRSGSGTPATIVLIGAADTDITRLEADPGIRILGPRPFARLPEYTAGFDVAIIPFTVSPLTVAVNPVKLREMLAAGCPVVATALPEVAAVARHNPDADAAGSAEAFIASVQRRLADAPLTLERRRAISDSVRHETWEARVEAILEQIA